MRAVAIERSRRTGTVGDALEPDHAGAATPGPALLEGAKPHAAAVPRFRQGGSDIDPAASLRSGVA